MTKHTPATSLPRFTRSHIRETLISCREDSSDAGLGELLRANEQYDALLAVNARLVRILDRFSQLSHDQFRKLAA